MNKFKELLKKLKKLKFPENEYVVFGSGPMAVKVCKIKICNSLEKEVWQKKRYYGYKINTKISEE